MKAATHFMRQIEQYRRAHAEWQAHGLAKQCSSQCIHLQTRVYPESCRRCPHLQEAQVQRV